METTGPRRSDDWSDGCTDAKTRPDAPAYLSSEFGLADNSERIEINRSKNDGPIE